MGSLVAVVVVLAAGCEQKKAPRYEGPMRVDFGDCAVDPWWVSSARPRRRLPPSRLLVRLAGVVNR